MFCICVSLPIRIDNIYIIIYIWLYVYFRPFWHECKKLINGAMVRPCSTAMSKNYRRVDSRKDQERWRFFFWVSCAVERGAWVTFNCLLMIVLFKMNLTAGILFWSFKSYGMSPEVHSANRNDPWLSDLYPFRRHLQTWAVPGLASEKNGHSEYE